MNVDVESWFIWRVQIAGEVLALWRESSPSCPFPRLSFVGFCHVCLPFLGVQVSRWAEMARPARQHCV